MQRSIYKTMFIIEYEYEFHAQSGQKNLHLLTYLDSICPSNYIPEEVNSWEIVALAAASCLHVFHVLRVPLQTIKTLINLPLFYNHHEIFQEQFQGLAELTGFNNGLTAKTKDSSE